MIVGTIGLSLATCSMSLSDVAVPINGDAEQMDAALSRKKSSWSPPRTFDGEAEAKLIALACTKPPQGYAHWTLRLLEQRVVELGIVEAASYTTIYRVLKENELKPHKNKYWVIPPEKDADFVAAMEDTLEVYTRPRDPARPVICLDETSKQLTRETRTPLPRGPGREERIDYEYERAGVANVFMLFVPLEGKRHVSVRKRRTAKDFAEVVRELVDVHFPLAEKIILVNDNLNCGKACKDDPLGGKSASSLTHLVWLQKLLFVVQRWKGKRG